MTDQYLIDDPDMLDAATVAVNPNGTTQQGWGYRGPKDPETGEHGEGFMPRFKRGEFNPRVTRYRYSKLGWPFAYIMRSVPLICVDIDGKNGGFDSTPQLGELPPTLAETSKSGNGYHLFYSTNDVWDDDLGYAMFDDIIGVVTGVDIRATGCVYHHDTQRWNGLAVAPIPERLYELLDTHKMRRAAFATSLTELKEMDMDDVLVAQHDLTQELAKPIASGKRNTTLFAIGSKLMAAGVPGWEDQIRRRADQLGLPTNEYEKIISNIVTYGD